MGPHAQKGSDMPNALCSIINPRGLCGEAHPDGGYTIWYPTICGADFFNGQCFDIKEGDIRDLDNLCHLLLSLRKRYPVIPNITVEAQNALAYYRLEEQVAISQGGFHCTDCGTLVIGCDHCDYCEDLRRLNDRTSEHHPWFTSERAVFNAHIITTLASILANSHP